VPIRSPEYTVGDPAIEFYVSWAESVGKCGGIKYSVQMADGQTLNQDWIVFDELNGKFSVSTNERKQAGIYAIKLSGFVKNMTNVTASQVFKVTIKDFCDDSAAIITSTLSPITYQLGS
jgi:hypothetical protein